MQYLRISRSLTLVQLIDLVGSRNIDVVLNANGLKRVPKIGKEFAKQCEYIISTKDNVSPERKDTLLKKLADSEEAFEYAALLDEDGWKVLSNLNTFPNALFIPDNVELSPNADIIGGDNPVGSSVFASVIDANITPPYFINPSLLNSYNSQRSSQIAASVATKQNSVPAAPMSPHYDIPKYSWQAKIPYTDVALYSSLTGEYVYFPVYPEEISDSITANYTTMSELLYQYEPWQIYQSSGDRSNSYSFYWHRDIWGDHPTNDQTNKIIRFCEANCYPRYNGSAVNTARVRLYYKGQILISGILTNVQVDWDGPLGHDDWYLCCKLTLSITEVSETPLNFDVVKAKGLIG